ncbi:hypothetical protein PR202_gb20086 [Eleusine coracana subsp. coracana]|uniref:AB hydrolase-1 domain-containing protein n=1 Tax=Eleusine coracana subsp. coracana TaxID=191504 RepID=A0AAV5F7P3_ELECO|nr:hypothetical protein PR202_gb20086 [Eleusine coracana subsp. coracana]
MAATDSAPESVPSGAAPPPPPSSVQHPRRRWQCVLSFTAARDRFLRRRFLSAGLRPFSVRLPSPAGTTTVVHWGPYLAKLLAAGFDPVVPDLLFFGGSSSTVEDWTDTFQAKTIKAAMDAMGVRRFAVVGVSYGGFVGYRMAAMYPEAVERVVMVSSGVCIEEDDLAAGLFPVTDIKEAAELLVPRRAEDVRRLVKLTFVRPPPIMPSCFLKDYIDVMGSDHIQEKTKLLHALISDRKLSDLPKITQPTLIIWGEKDQVFPMELAHRLERHLGENSRLVVVKNAGHAANLEKSKEEVQKC